MGTRAQFFVGDPCDVENREWLGCVAYDGYPDGDLESLAACKTENEFRAELASITAKRDDFADPTKHDFPFPWKNNVFLTDCTYAFRDGKLMFNYFRSQPLPMAEFLALPKDTPELPDTLPSNVPAPRNVGKPAGADSIMINQAR